MTLEELARQYADQQVDESPENEYKQYSHTKQKELTRFDGYDIEQAYEDGGKRILEEIDRVLCSRIVKNRTKLGDVMELVRKLKNDKRS